MKWNNISVTADKQSVDDLESCLWELGAVSVSVSDAGDNPLYEPAPGETPLWQSMIVVGLFEEGMSLPEISASLEDRGYKEFDVSELKDRVWEREWLTHFSPMQFGDRLWVCPTEKEQKLTAALDGESCIIRLDPGLAFGTGTHATTALCLAWLEQNTPRGGTVVDYGCGSGILSIAAAKLGAGRITAIDNDPQALAATGDNARNNDVLDQLDISLPRQLPGEGYDLVVANILAQPLVELAGMLTGLLRPGGQLVLSGIMESQREWVAGAYAGLQPVENRLRDGWVLMQFTVPG